MLRPLRNFWINLNRRLRGQPAPPKRKPLGPPRVDFSYTIFWTKQARSWEASRRAAVLAALEPVLAQPGFEANDYERRYTVPGLDAQAHAGASLVALDKVLRAFDQAPA
jgi:hypothetical protein